MSKYKIIPMDHEPSDKQPICADIDLEAIPEIVVHDRWLPIPYDDSFTCVLVNGEEVWKLTSFLERDSNGTIINS